MGELERRSPKLGRKKVDFNACSATRGSTFSIFVKLNQSYENTVFDHRAGDCRVFQLLSVTKERGDCGNDHHNHSRHGQEDDSEDLSDEDAAADDAAADAEPEGVEEEGSG